MNITGDQRKLASLWYGEEERERGEKRDKDEVRRGGEKEDGKRQKKSQIGRGVVHILWSSAVEINGLQHRHRLQLAPLYRIGDLQWRSAKGGIGLQKRDACRN
jgi:hypothetical protein